MNECEYTQEELEEAVKWLKNAVDTGPARLITMLRATNKRSVTGKVEPEKIDSILFIDGLKKIAIVLAHLDACDKFIEKLGWSLPK